MHPLDLLVLGEEVFDGAFAAEEVAVRAGDGVAGAEKAEVAGIEGFEAFAGEAGALFAVVAL